jgi:hypothetical protein
MYNVIRKRGDLDVIWRKIKKSKRGKRLVSG